jgi:FMN-dependent oxidoreductase (nitrilotriacetate monooxygenase family)
MTNPQSPKRRRQLSFNVLDMSSVSHNNYGLWRLPSNRKTQYTDLSYWIDHARAAERALFDSVFFADLIGVAAGYGGSNDVALREAMHVPNIDPVMLLSAMAAATRHIGLGATVSTTYEPPFAHARRFSTLDHLTGGRVAWNIVTTYLPNADENFGLPPDRYQHDERYDLADEFVDVCYKLWEASWEDDAVLRDRVNHVYTDPAKVHRIDHKGRYFSCAGPHLCEPSPQRTPVIFQAGSSGRGKSFAGRHAEVIFVGGRTWEAVKINVADARAAVRAAGRSQEDVRVISDVGIIVARTDAEAQARLASYQALSSPHGYLAHQSGSGFDLTRFSRSTTQEEIIALGGPGAAHMSRYNYPAGTTVGEIIDRAVLLERNPFLCVGCTERVADQVEEWVETYDLDGFLCRQLETDATIRDIGDFLIPELARRGLHRGAYRGSTLREQIFGTKHLAATHPGSRYRRHAAMPAPVEDICA